MDKELAIKFAVVFLYHGVGSVLPLALALLEKNAAFVVLIPVIKALWECVEDLLKKRGILGAGKWH